MKEDGFLPGPLVWDLSVSLYDHMNHSLLHVERLGQNHRRNLEGAEYSQFSIELEDFCRIFSKSIFLFDLSVMKISYLIQIIQC